MLNKKTILTVVAIILVALGVNLEQLGIDLGLQQDRPIATRSTAPAAGGSASSNERASSSSPKQGQHWSDTRPKVNLRHVFEGEINRKGKPVGFHSRPGGQDPAGARVVAVKSKPNKHGVYTATIEVKDGSQWKEKFSSFFPDDMDRGQVLDAILNAYSNSSDPNAQPWRGPSGAGFDVQGYTLRKGDINTAFPVYTR